jgi:hypothetical protein
VSTAQIEAPASPGAFYESLRSRGPTLNLLFEQARMSLDREDDTILRDAFAGTIVVILNDMLRGFWRAHAGSKADWKNLGQRVRGHSIAQILAAAVDNFHHFEEWDASKPDIVWDLRSTKILCDILDIPAKKTHKQPPFRGNVCWAVLDAVTAGEAYGKLDALVREFAAALEAKRA